MCEKQLFIVLLLIILIIIMMMIIITTTLFQEDNIFSTSVSIHMVLNYDYKLMEKRITETMKKRTSNAY